LLSELSRTVAEQLKWSTDASREDFEAFSSGQKAAIGELASKVESMAKELGVSVESWRATQQDALAAARQEQTEALTASRGVIDNRLEKLSETFAWEQEQARKTIAESLEAVRRDNEAKLEQMRATVQEKLDATLGERLDASFKVVSEHLESVHKGLGEMQALAQGVGSLQRTLTNVKTRGIWGELQLQTLLSDLLTQEQYERQCRVTPDGGELADFAVRMPGGSDGQPVRLVIDAKFPMDVYDRYTEAWESGDKDAYLAAGKALEDRIVAEAKSIRSKYVHTPYTTDFAVMYLPTEGLFAEVVRRSELFHRLRQDHKVIVAGPTTLTALLGSLSLGFRSLAIQKRSSEAWTVLGKVKTEFEKSGTVWEKLVKQLETASKTAGDAGVRHRSVARSLRTVEAVPIDAPPSRPIGGLAEDSGVPREIPELVMPVEVAS
jgi:DNA recombination protein RmuC